MDARRQLREIIAGYLDVRAEKIRTDAESVYIGEEKQPVDTIKNILDNIGDFTIIGTGARGPNDPAKDASTFGAQFAEVEVNTGTGEVNVLKLISVNDFGRVMNILGSANQIKGAVVQGIGYALTEERVIDPKSGIVLNPNLEDYKIPTALDFGDIDCAFINEPDNGANILGAKGLGEPGLIPTAPAIANAIAHALNIRFLSLPITRDKILEALEKPESQGGTYL
jgi:xanthine dehydrogenase YagR molybdenum-binding subunit